MVRHALFSITAICLLATPAMAEIPRDVQAMIDAAIATGDAQKVETVVALAKQTQPDSAAEIEAHAAFVSGMGDKALWKRYEPGEA